MTERGITTRPLILAGGLSHERDVSLRSGRRVADALRESGVVVSEIDPDDHLIESLRSERPDVVIPLLHGAAGEDGAIRDLLQLLNLPYIGSTPEVCRLAFDKPIAKEIVAAAGVRTPQSIVLPQESFRELGAGAVLALILEGMALPLMVKPTKGGSALGATVVREASALADAMMSCFSYGDSALIEEYITGREIAVAVLDVGDGPVALTPIEIAPDSGFYSYEARYTAGLTEFFTPARIDDRLMASAQQVALDAHQALRLRDISRTDMMIDSQGVIWFLEVNVAPGMTETSLVPQALTASGLILGSVYRQLMDVAISRGN
jgi:D-alanine-D-alanine ligase